MSEDVRPYGAANDPAIARVEEFSALLAELEKSQREGAELLEMEPRSIRRFLSGETPPPMTVIYSMRYFAAVKRGELDAEQELADRLSGGHYSAADAVDRGVRAARSAADVVSGKAVDEHVDACALAGVHC
jgi:hypothetical protein